MKICFIAPSSYGKSTAVQIISKYFDATNIKIANPLYDLQNKFYLYIDKQIGNTQDGELLQFLGIKIRKENPNFLLNCFLNSVEKCSSQIVTNDDCRPPDYKTLKQMGFIFIKINGFPRERDDYIKPDAKNKIEWQSEIPCDYELNNTGTLEEYEENILKLLKEILENEKMLYSPSRKLLL